MNDTDTAPQDNAFKSWAIVEVMGHVTYAGFVTVETIAGAAMLRVDVPPVGNIPAFTKYIAPGSLYGLTPSTETTTRAKAAQLRAKPADCWNMEGPLMEQLRAKGQLAPPPPPRKDYCDHCDRYQPCHCMATMQIAPDEEAERS